MKIKAKIKDFAGDKRVQLAAAVFITLLTIAVGVTVAWFSNNDSLKTVAKVRKPTEIQVRAGNAEDIDRLDLGNINVKDALEDGAELTEDGTYVRRYVFCVCSEKDEYTSDTNYTIQLAHTTNLDFKYSIYSATDITDEENTDGYVTAEYTDTSGKTHIYRKDDNITLSKAADEDDYADTYGSYTNVQTNAKPIYWQSEEITLHYNKASTYNDTEWNFVDFYILEVEWDEEEAKSWLDKESDMVYLLADS